MFTIHVGRHFSHLHRLLSKYCSGKCLVCLEAAALLTIAVLCFNDVASWNLTNTSITPKADAVTYHPGHASFDSTPPLFKQSC